LSIFAPLFGTPSSALAGLADFYRVAVFPPVHALGPNLVVARESRYHGGPGTLMGEVQQIMSATERTSAIERTAHLGALYLPHTENTFCPTRLGYQQRPKGQPDKILPPDFCCYSTVLMNVGRRARTNANEDVAGKLPVTWARSTPDYSDGSSFRSVIAMASTRLMHGAKKRPMS
jgi:hypothetical protein